MKYLSVVKNAIQNEIVYRASYWSTLLGTVLKVFLTYCLWKAIYMEKTFIGNYDFTKMIMYSFISIILLQLNSFGAGRTLSLMIARGEIAVELIRPYNLITKLLFYNLGVKIVDLFRYCIPMVLTAAILLKDFTQYSIVNLLLFVISAIVGMITIQFIDLLISMMAFFTTNTWGLWIFRNSLVCLFSGSILPLDVFPKWFFSISKILPFNSAIYLPLDILFDQSLSTITLNLAYQFIWCTSLCLIVYFAYSRIIKKLQVFGG